ncbi:MAG: Gfo/Idh/MocA family oxidoreductase [Planctomycetales bacterium]|nr:Gfo/Idh/MocA family oxidoreductase [Planctomycetales bacterium]
MVQSTNRDASSLARRSFIKDSGLMIAGGAIGGAIAVGKAVKGGPNSPIKIALVGCGRRARELADAVMAVPNESVQLVALADTIPSQSQSVYRSLKGRYGDRVAEDCLRSNGPNCIDPILESSADVVYVTTPPIDRPEYFRKIVESGKHVFLEKPLAADVAGVIDILSTSRKADAAGISVHVGFQRRYDARYRDVIARLHDGAIGTPVFARAFCNAGPLRTPTRVGNESEIDFQRRNWNHFQWTGGDFLVEQHVAGLDVIRWALDQVPVVAQGQGGWGSFETAEDQSKLSMRQGEVFDHHSVEYEFGNGIVLMSQCRRVAKAWNNTSEHIHGTTGRADLTAGTIYDLDGTIRWQSEHPFSLKSATIQQQRAFLASIRIGKPENQIESAAESTLFAMLGHHATRSGKRVRFEKLLSGAGIA